MKKLRRDVRLAELLGVTVHDLRAYSNRRKAIRAGWKLKRFRAAPGHKKQFRSSQAIQPSVADRELATIKEQANTGKLPPALLTLKAPIDLDENQLYDQWRNGSDEEKQALEQQIYDAAFRHAEAVVHKEFGKNLDLPHDIASAAVQKLPSFRQESKFSTFVVGIAKNKIMEKKRKLAREKKRFDLKADYDKALEKYHRFDGAARLDTDFLIHELSEGLNNDERVLFELMLDDRDTSEIAAVFDISQDAAESRRRRLRDKLQRQILWRRRN